MSNYLSSVALLVCAATVFYVQHVEDRLVRLIDKNTEVVGRTVVLFESSNKRADIMAETMRVQQETIKLGQHATLSEYELPSHAGLGEGSALFPERRFLWN